MAAQAKCQKLMGRILPRRRPLSRVRARRRGRIPLHRRWRSCSTLPGACASHSVPRVPRPWDLCPAPPVRLRHRRDNRLRRGDPSVSEHAQPGRRRRTGRRRPRRRRPRRGTRHSARTDENQISRGRRLGRAGPLPAGDGSRLVLPLLLGCRRWLGVVVLGTRSSSPRAADNATAWPARRPCSDATWSKPTPSPERSATTGRRPSTTASAERSRGFPVGQEIKPGQTLYKVDGQPVILMDGTTPAYRDLEPGRQRRRGHRAAQPQPRQARLQRGRHRRRRRLASRDHRRASTCCRNRSARRRPAA